MEAGEGKPVAAFTYGITKYRVRLTARAACFKGKPPGPGQWISAAEMEELVMSSAHRRVRGLLPATALSDAALRLRDMPG